MIFCIKYSATILFVKSLDFDFIPVGSADLSVLTNAEVLQRNHRLEQTEMCCLHIRELRTRDYGNQVGWIAGVAISTV